MDKPIKLPGGIELVAFDEKTKSKLEAEILEILNKYEATYLPVIKEIKTLSEHRTSAELYLLKKVIKKEDDEIEKEEGKEAKA